MKVYIVLAEIDADSSPLVDSVWKSKKHAEKRIKEIEKDYWCTLFEKQVKE